jgi:hypothetical protein
MYEDRVCFTFSGNKWLGVIYKYGTGDNLEFL